MTDTTILDAMVQMLEGGDPLWAGGEAVDSADQNHRYRDVAAYFAENIEAPRQIRTRNGVCETQGCPGPVRALETRIPGAVRVDGQCETCGFSFSRAGFTDAAVRDARRGGKG